jgi:hypothetical protein
MGRKYWGCRGFPGLHLRIVICGSVRLEPPIGPKVVKTYGKTFGYTEMIRNRMKTLKLTTLGPLAVARMEGGDLIVLRRDSCGHAAVHATAHQNYGFGFAILVHFLCDFGPPVGASRSWILIGLARESQRVGLALDAADVRPPDVLMKL